MTQPVYEKLTEALKMRGGAAPAIHCPEFYAIIEELFTPDEADLASKMPLGLVSAADMAKETGCDPKVAGELLESMANKGLLASYKAPKSVEFVSEFPKGGTGKMLKPCLGIFIRRFWGLAVS